MKSSFPHIFRQFIVFCGVGAINTLVGLAVILYLSEMAGFDYRLSNFLGYMVGLVIGFVLHRSITFKNESDRKFIRREFAHFTLIFVFAYGLQFIALYALVEYIGLINWVAQILAVGIYTICNYLGNRMITFSENKEKAS